jgi:hypothetical protein
MIHKLFYRSCMTVIEAMQHAQTKINKLSFQGPYEAVYSSHGSHEHSVISHDVLPRF